MAQKAHEDEAEALAVARKAHEDGAEALAVAWKAREDEAEALAVARKAHEDDWEARACVKKPHVGWEPHVKTMENVHSVRLPRYEYQSEAAQAVEGASAQQDVKMDG
jgi:hypothetical protein